MTLKTLIQSFFTMNAHIEIESSLLEFKDILEKNIFKTKIFCIKSKILQFDDLLHGEIKENKNKKIFITLYDSICKFNCPYCNAYDHNVKILLRLLKPDKDMYFENFSELTHKKNIRADEYYIDFEKDLFLDENILLEFISKELLEIRNEEINRIRSLYKVQIKESRSILDFRTFIFKENKKTITQNLKYFIDLLIFDDFIRAEELLKNLKIDEEKLSIFVDELLFYCIILRPNYTEIISFLERIMNRIYCIHGRIRIIITFMIYLTEENLYKEYLSTLYFFINTFNYEGYELSKAVLSYELSDILLFHQTQIRKAIFFKYFSLNIFLQKNLDHSFFTDFILEKTIGDKSKNITVFHVLCFYFKKESKLLNILLKECYHIARIKNNESQLNSLIKSIFQINKFDLNLAEEFISNQTNIEIETNLIDLNEIKYFGGFNGLKKTMKNEIFLNIFETLSLELKIDIEIIFMKYNHTIENYELKKVNYIKTLDKDVFKYKIQFYEEGNYKIHKLKIKYKNSWFYQIIDRIVNIERNRIFFYLEAEYPSVFYCFEEININCKIITNYTEEFYLDMNAQEIIISREQKELNNSCSDRIMVYNVGLKCKYLDSGKHLAKLALKDFVSEEILITVIPSVIVKTVFLKFLTDFFFILVKNISDKPIELNNFQILNPNYSIENIYLVNLKIDFTNFERYFTEYYENIFSQNINNILISNKSVQNIFENNTFDVFFLKNILKNLILEKIEHKIAFCLNPNEEYVFCVQAKYFQRLKINEILEKNLCFLFKDTPPETYDYKNGCKDVLENQIDIQKFIDLKNIFLKNYFNFIDISKNFLDFFPLFIDREIPIRTTFNQNISVEDFKECFYKIFLAINTDKMKNPKFLFHESIMEFEKFKLFFIERQEENRAFYLVFYKDLQKNKKSEIHFAFFNFLSFKNMNVKIICTENILLACENTSFILDANSFKIKKYEIIPLISGDIPISDLFIINFNDKQLSNYKKQLLINNL